MSIGKNNAGGWGAHVKECSRHKFKHQGPVVRKLINANPGLNVSEDFISLFKKLMFSKGQFLWLVVKTN